MFGGPPVTNDLEIKNIVEITRKEFEKGISIFWGITFTDEKEFIGFIRLMSYNSEYFDASFESMGHLRYSYELLNYIDKTNGWEIDYAILKEYRGQGIMTETIEYVLEFCNQKQIYPIYAKVNNLSNKATVKVLLKNESKKLLPQLNREGEMGMIYKWTK